MKQKAAKKVSALQSPISSPTAGKLRQDTPPTISSLLSNLRNVILEARQQSISAVDVIQVRTCWIVGRHIIEFEQAGKTRAAYGKAVLAQVSTQLTAEFGSGFDERNLRNMRAFYSAFPIWNALRSELSWTHYRLLLRVDSAARIEQAPYSPPRKPTRTTRKSNGGGR